MDEKFNYNPERYKEWDYLVPELLKRISESEVTVDPNRSRIVESRNKENREWESAVESFGKLSEALSRKEDDLNTIFDTETALCNVLNFLSNGALADSDILNIHLAVQKLVHTAKVFNDSNAEIQKTLRIPIPSSNNELVFNLDPLRNNSPIKVWIGNSVDEVELDDNDKNNLVEQNLKLLSIVKSENYFWTDAAKKQK